MAVIGTLIWMSFGIAYILIFMFVSRAERRLGKMSQARLQNT